MALRAEDQTMNNAKEVGAKIKRFREHAQLNQSELARLVKVSPTAVHNWEKKGVIPRAAVWHDLSQALGVEISQLLGWDLYADKAGDGERAAIPCGEAIRAERLAQIKREIAVLYNVSQSAVDIVVRV